MLKVCFHPQDRQKPDELLGPLCDLLFTIYRSSPKLGSQARRFSLQFIPHLVYLYLQVGFSPV